MNIVARIKNILLSPKSEWGVIDGESASVASLYTGYAIPLALIPAIAGFIGTSFVGISMFGTTFRTPIGAGIATAIFSFIITMVMLYVIALVINALAPNFGGQANFVQALKVVVYSSTPSWVLGILTLLPMLSLVLILAGIYGLVLYWMGLPRLMKVPEEKKIGFNITVFVCAIVLGIVVAVLNGMVGTMFGAGAVTPEMMQQMAPK